MVRSSSFLSTPSARRATGTADALPTPIAVFLSTPSARRATALAAEIKKQADEFLSTPSARRATTRKSVSWCIILNFYPRPPRGGRHDMYHTTLNFCYFYPRPPRGGRRGRAPLFASLPHFYPRPPRGGRPVRAAPREPAIQGISIHALREEGDGRKRYLGANGGDISIHALREEGDITSSIRCRERSKFLSTPSARRATHREIDIFNCFFYFYPRPPRGGRRPLTCAFDISSQFLSTPSARRATSVSVRNGYDQTYFYPRPPRGGRQFPTFPRIPVL